MLDLKESTLLTNANLLAISIGTSASALKVVEKLGIPPQIVYADEYNDLHQVINLNKSFRTTFTSVATPRAILKRLTTPDGMKNLQTVLGKWISEDLVIIPPKRDQAFNQGGCFVFDSSGILRLAHCDRGTGDHVDLAGVEKCVEDLLRG